MKKKILMSVILAALIAVQLPAFAAANTNSDLVLTGEDAINCVKATGFKLTSDRERYMPVQVADGYHVYIQTRLPGGGYADVAAFSVKCLGGQTERSF